MCRMSLEGHMSPAIVLQMAGVEADGHRAVLDEIRPVSMRHALTTE